MAEAFLRGHAPLTPLQAQMISPLRLAYVGDAVHELFVRTGLAFGGGKAGSMHREAICAVNAAGQALALERIRPALTETENDIVRRGRNAHAHHAAPKHADPADYALATGFEALVGYLYLSDQMNRLEDLYNQMNEQTEPTDGAKGQGANNGIL